MLKLLVALQTLALATKATTVKADNDMIHFVFEITRHGARAPSSDLDGYKVAANELTAQGMRQRFLLGTFNRERYIDQYGLLPEKLTPYDRSIKMTSTDVDRTFQSGYSELMGIYGPGSGSGWSLTDSQAHNLVSIGIGLPPFTLRNAGRMNNILGNKALPNEFVSIPVFSYLEKNLVDDLDLGGCSYVAQVDNYRFPKNETYDDYAWLFPLLREPLKEAFNYTEEEAMLMDFMTMYGDADVYQSRTFEGLPFYYNFNDDELRWLNQTVLATLSEPMADPVLARNMYASKQTRKADRQIQALIYHFVNGQPLSQDEADLKLLAYSTHDWTVATMLLWLNATNGNFTVVPYAANIHFELHSTTGCAATECFWMEIYSNGQTLEFADVCVNPSKCTVKEFYNMFKSRDFVHTGSYYNDECSQNWTPPVNSDLELIEDFLTNTMKAK